MTATDARAPMPSVGDPQHVPLEVSAGAHFPALDGYRAIAALMVVGTHVAFSTGFVVQSGLGHVFSRFDFGVPLFFLMSGFLLYRPWVRHAFEGRPSPRLRTYALRRAARILPLYWVVVAVVLLLLPEIQPVSGAAWWIHLAGLQIYWPSGPIEGLTQTWSLCTEISFYVALPLLGLLARSRRDDLGARYRRQLWLLGAMVLVANAYNVTRLFTDALPFNAQYWLPAYLDWFAAGMLLAVVDVRRRLPDAPGLVRSLSQLGQDQVTSLVLAAAVFAVAVTPLGGSYDFTPTGPWENYSKHLLYLLAAFFFLAPGVLGDPSRGVGRALSRSVPHRLGLISYGIFLWHLVLIRTLMAELGIGYFDGSTWLVLGVVLVATIAVSAVTYRLVERPAQLWAHRR